MADLGLRTSPVGQFVQLNSALERATGVLSKAESTSAAKACLAEAILSLAAEGGLDQGQGLLCRLWRM